MSQMVMTKVNVYVPIVSFPTRAQAQDHAVSMVLRTDRPKAYRKRVLKYRKSRTHWQFTIARHVGNIPSGGAR